MQFKCEKADLNDSGYPFLLREIQNPPLSIYFRGEIPDDSKIKVAIVGTRKATSAGKDLAKYIAGKLAGAGIVVVSGLAMGIDTAAHEGALLKNGKTLAVLGCGADIIYPAQNNNLAKEIINGSGAIISEYEPGTPVLPYRFLERNRIVAGLSLATIVIEAPKNSGAIVTARLAAESGREVLVFPGPANHPNYAGSHSLIRDGARLVSSFEDIIEDLNLEISNTAPGKNIFDSIIGNIKDKNQQLILRVINDAGTSLNIDKIFELTKLEPQTVNQAIALLVIEGIIKETEGGYSV